jgi:NTP pyrophosphatase (non-canonical NTP hydrolase)
MYCAGKLNGEAGEVAEVVFKGFREGGIGPEQVQKLEKELGDVLWYIARLADLCGFTLEHIMKVNLAKLASRKERGVIQGYGDDR